MSVRNEHKLQPSNQQADKTAMSYFENVLLLGFLCSEQNSNTSKKDQICHGKQTKAKNSKAKRMTTPHPNRQHSSQGLVASASAWW
jgi:hypothetical protein